MKEVVSGLIYPMNFSLYYIYFYIHVLRILPMNFVHIIVEIDKGVMLTCCIHCGWCELFDSVYLYAESQVLIEMVIR